MFQVWKYQFFNISCFNISCFMLEISCFSVLNFIFYVSIYYILYSYVFMFCWLIDLPKPWSQTLIGSNRDITAGFLNHSSWHELQRCSWCSIRKSTGNFIDVSCHYFCQYFFLNIFHFLCCDLFSYNSRSDKKLPLAKVIWNTQVPIYMTSTAPIGLFETLLHHRRWTSDRVTGS